MPGDSDPPPPRFPGLYPSGALTLLPCSRGSIVRKARLLESENARLRGETQRLLSENSVVTLKAQLAEQNAEKDRREAALARYLWGA